MVAQKPAITQTDGELSQYRHKPNGPLADARCRFVKNPQPQQDQACENGQGHVGGPPVKPDQQPGAEGGGDEGNHRHRPGKYRHDLGGAIALVAIPHHRPGYYRTAGCRQSLGQPGDPHKFHGGGQGTGHAGAHEQNGARNNHRQPSVVIGQWAKHQLPRGNADHESGQGQLTVGFGASELLDDRRDGWQVEIGGDGRIGDQAHQGGEGDAFLHMGVS